ncbi:MAG: metallophosphoesterase family protein [Alphaproteobacteria bacterium]|nr:metallophosphoesterase family protein [Alphaproteobacteria bacterium]
MSVPRHRVQGRRFGLLADTHDDAVDWPKAVEKIRAAWGEVDAIIHCGDLCTANAIATLSALAPVWATRNPQTDPPANPPMLIDGPRVLEVGSSGVGVLFSLSGEPVKAETDPVLRFTGLPPETALQDLFGGKVDVCVWGGTHAARVRRRRHALRQSRQSHAGEGAHRRRTDPRGRDGERGDLAGLMIVSPLLPKAGG